MLNIENQIQIRERGILNIFILYILLFYYILHLPFFQSYLNAVISIYIK
jgi:hypothetical protein